MLSFKTNIEKENRFVVLLSYQVLLLFEYLECVTTSSKTRRIMIPKMIRAAITLAGKQGNAKNVIKNFIINYDCLSRIQNFSLDAIKR